MRFGYVNGKNTVLTGEEPAEMSKSSAFYAAYITNSWAVYQAVWIYFLRTVEPLLFGAPFVSHFRKYRCIGNKAENGRVTK